MDWLSPLRELFGFVFPFLERLPVIRAILGFVLVFFLPGFAWSLVFFRQIKALERTVLSFVLSIVVVTLSLLFVTRLTGVRVIGLNSVLIIIAITILPIIFYYLNGYIKRRRGKAA